MSLEAVRVVAIGSLNPVKIAAVRAVLAPRAPGATFTGRAVASGGGDQPFGDDDTIRGARTRAEAALRALDADLGVGIEGGCVETPGGMRTCAWAVVVDRTGRVGTGGSLAMPLPQAVARPVRG